MTIHSAVYHHLSENMNISQKQHNILIAEKDTDVFLGWLQALLSREAFLTKLARLNIITLEF